MRAQELLDRGDKEDGMQIMKTQNRKLVAQGMNIGHRNTRKHMSVDMWNARLGGHKKREQI